MFANLVDGNVETRGNMKFLLAFEAISQIIFFQKWQIGTVFIPDSIGYFISTNFFAILAHKMGQIETAILSLIIVGISSLFVSFFHAIILFPFCSIEFDFAHRFLMQHRFYHLLFHTLHSALALVHLTWLLSRCSRPSSIQNISGTTIQL